MTTASPSSATSASVAAPWGVLPTIGFSLVIFAVFLAVQSAALAIFAYFQLQQQADTSLAEMLQQMATQGLGISVSLIPGTLAGSLLILLFAYLRGNITLKHYLHLNRPAIKPFLFWLTVLVLFAVGMELVNHLNQRPMPNWMIDSYRTAGIIPLFWFTLVIAAPVFEELLFRGFLLEGLRHSSVGTAGAVIVTAALWASIHLQYECFEIISIFLIGLILGYAKIKTRSIYTPIILHALMNLAATAQVAALVSSS